MCMNDDSASPCMNEDLTSMLMENMCTHVVYFYYSLQEMSVDCQNYSLQKKLTIYVQDQIQS